MKQNITVSLDRELIRKLKVIAASRETSISRMLGEELRLIVEHAEQYENAKRRAMAVLDSGLHLGGKPIDRDALHER